jgi:hypothetical protein
LIIDYGKPVSRGYLEAGESQLREVSTRHGPRKVKIWTAVRPSDEPVTRTRVCFEWNGVAWKLVHLFPDATRLDAATGVYTSQAHRYVRY